MRQTGLAITLVAGIYLICFSIYHPGVDPLQSFFGGALLATYTWLIDKKDREDD